MKANGFVLARQSSVFELVFGGFDVVLIGVEIFLQNDLRGDVGRGVGEEDTPDSFVWMCLSVLP